MTALKPPRHIFREYDIRGLAEKELTDETCRLIGEAFGSFLAEEKQGKAARQKERGVRESPRPRVGIGRDLRPSSERIQNALFEGLLAAGIDVVNLGLIPTPVLYFAIVHFSLDAGISLTGSHNLPEYNGFKFQLADRPFYGDDIRRLAKWIEGERAGLRREEEGRRGEGTRQGKGSEEKEEKERGEGAGRGKRGEEKEEKGPLARRRKRNERQERREGAERGKGAGEKDRKERKEGARQGKGSGQKEEEEGREGPGKKKEEERKTKRKEQERPGKEKEGKTKRRRKVTKGPEGSGGGAKSGDKKEGNRES